MMLTESQIPVWRALIHDRRSIASRWNMQHIDGLWLIAVLPSLAVPLYVNALPLLVNLIVAIVTLQLWHSTSRYRPDGISRWQGARFISINQCLQGTLFVLLLPLDISPLQLVLVVSFGTMFGEQLFGGRGFTFLNPVVTGMSFYLFSFNLNLDDPVIATVHLGFLIPGFLALLLCELLSLRTVVGMGLGAAFVLLLQDNAVFALQTLIGSSAAWLALVFLANDPGSGGSSNPARWVHGTLLGALVLILAGAEPSRLSALVFAILLASLSAPLIDYIIMKLYTRRRHRLRINRRAGRV